MPSFTYGLTTIEYELEYTMEKKDISISVEWLNGVKVIAPNQIDEQKLQSVLNKKAPWILKKWKECHDIEALPAPKEFVSGEKFPYLGRHYRFKIHKIEDLSRPTLQLKRGRFISEIPYNITPEEKQTKLIECFKEWYIDHGTKKIDERLSIYISKMDVSPTKFALKEQKMRWGTCTQGGAIYLNWRIIMAPMSIIDYLLVHELTHLKYPNHSKEFWGFVRSILPDYEERKEWLRINGPTLTIN